MSMWYSIALGHHEQPAKAAMEKKVGTPRAAVSPRCVLCGPRASQRPHDRAVCSGVDPATQDDVI